jgi:hypothetical protein
VSVDLHGVFLAFLTFRNHRHLKSHWRRQRLRSPPNPETSIKITAYVQASSFKSTICSVSQTRVDPNTYSCHPPHCYPHCAVIGTWELGMQASKG